MSSHFSSPSPVQKPPHICNKPPTGPDYIPPALPNQPLQGFVTYSTPYSPSEGGMISIIALRPTVYSNTWAGSAAAGIFRIELIMECDVDRTELAFQFKWFVSETLYDTINIHNIIPRSWAPFDSGLVIPKPQPTNGTNTWRIWF